MLHDLASKELKIVSVTNIKGMSYCGWDSGEHYKDHFEDGKFNVWPDHCEVVVLKVHPEFLCHSWPDYGSYTAYYLLCAQIKNSVMKLSPYSLTQELTCAPSVATIFSTVRPSSSTLRRGLHSRIQWGQTAYPSTKSRLQPLKSCVASVAMD